MRLFFSLFFVLLSTNNAMASDFKMSDFGEKSLENLENLEPMSLKNMSLNIFKLGATTMIAGAIPLGVCSATCFLPDLCSALSQGPLVMIMVGCMFAKFGSDVYVRSCKDYNWTKSQYQTFAQTVRQAYIAKNDEGENRQRALSHLRDFYVWAYDMDASSSCESIDRFIEPLAEQLVLANEAGYFDVKWQSTLHRSGNYKNFPNIFKFNDDSSLSLFNAEKLRIFVDSLLNSTRSEYLSPATLLKEMTGLRAYKMTEY